MTSTIEREEERVRALFERVEAVEDVADSIRPDRPEEARRLLSVSRAALDDADPVRARIAAGLLRISERTVRTWAAEGLLTRGTDAGRLLLDPVRLHEVWHLVRELREAGRDRDLMTALWYRLRDDELLDREDLAESLAQWRAGERVPARTRAEEPAGRR